LTGSHIARVFACGLVAMQAGCTLLKLEQDSRAYYESTVLVGRVDCASPCGGPIRIAAVPSEAPGSVEHHVLLHEAGGYELIVREGRYRVLAFADTNGNGRPDAGEPVAQLGQREPVAASGSGVVVGLDLLLQPGALEWPAGAVGSTPRSTQAGAPATLDSPALAASVGQHGYWSPMEAFKAGSGNVHFLEPYDPARTPVLFVHGAAGSAQDFRAVIAGLDRSRYQAWVYQYPSGAAVESMAYLLYWKLLNLRLRHNFPSLVVVAHSMGGLVVRSFLVNHGAEFPQLRLFVSISTPWGGEPSADLGVRHSPAVVPSWRDMQPDGDFMRTLFERRLPAHVQQVLYFGHKGGYSLMRPTTDGTVTLASQLRMPAQAEARLVVGFDEDHTSILGSPQMTAQLGALLSAFDPQGGRAGRLDLGFRWEAGAEPQPGTFPLVLQPEAGGEPMVLAVQAAPGRIGPIAPGRYVASLVAPGFASQPAFVPVALPDGETAALGFALRPQGMLAGYVGDDADSVRRPAGSWRPPHPLLRIRSITLEGAGIRRRLEPQAGGPDETLAHFARGADYAYRASFAFVNLPAGDYELTIEADGREPHRSRHGIVPGRPSPVSPIVMRPLAR
jgi:pimeloyl-ACP methyl ester carboxylesterase